MPLLADQHIVGLNVSMDNIVFVQVLERQNNLGRIERGHVFVKCAKCCRCGYGKGLQCACVGSQCACAQAT